MADRTTTITLRVADAFSGPLRQFEHGLGQAQRGLAGLERAGRSLTSIGQSLTIATAPLAVMGGMATKVAIDFDRAMRNVNSIAKMSERDLAAMRKAVLDLSKGLPQSAVELARGLYDIESSGFAGAKAVEVLQASARAASAGLTSTAVSARVITGVLNSYGEAAYTADQASDILFKTVDKGVLTFEELAQHMGEALPTAAALNVPLEQLGAAMATMTRRGINAAEAATSLNRVMLSLLDPSKEAEKLAKALGLEWNAEALASKGLIGVLDDMISKTAGSKEAVAVLTGDVRALRGVLSLTQDGGTLFNQMLADMSAASGSTKVALDEQSKSFAFQSEILRNQVMASLLDMAQVAMPRAIGATRALQQAITGMSEEGKAKIVLLALTLTAGGPLLIGIGLAIRGFAALSGAITAFSATAVGKIGLVIGAIGAASFAAMNLSRVLTGKGMLGPGEFGQEMLGGLEDAFGVTERRQEAQRRAAELLTQRRLIESQFGPIGPGPLMKETLGGSGLPTTIDEIDAALAQLDERMSGPSNPFDQIISDMQQGDAAATAALEEWKRLNEEVAAGEAPAREYENSLEKVNAALAGLSGAAGGGGALKTASLDVGRLADAMVTTSPVIQGINMQIIGLEAEQAGLTAAMRANSAAVRDAQEALRKLQETQSRLNKELGEAKSRLQDLASVRLTGQGAFEESQFEIEQQLKRLRLAEITGKPVTGTPPQFAGMTREQLESLREAAQLERSLANDPLMRQIQAAATPAKPEMSFEAAMAQVQSTHANIARLEGELRANEAAIRAQEDVVRALQAAGQALAEQQEQVGIALAKARRAHDMVSDAIKTGIEWHAKLRPEMLKTGLLSEEQAQMVDEAISNMLTESLSFMTTVTDEAMKNLESAERRYQELISKMIVASNAFAEAFTSVEQTGGFQVGGRVQVASRPAFQTGGMVRVGELGPELVSLPSGSRVVPAADTAMLTRSGRAGSGPEVHLHVGAMMGTDRDAQDFAKLVHQYIVRERDWS